MLATCVCAPCGRIHGHRQARILFERNSPALKTKLALQQFKLKSVDQPWKPRQVQASGLPFFGGLGCLPLLIFAPFLAAIFAVWSILATIQFIIVSTILLGAAAATAFLVLPQARNAVKALFSSEAEENASAAGKKRSNMVIDIEPDPEVKRGYDDLDEELRRFDEDLRRRRR